MSGEPIRVACDDCGSTDYDVFECPTCGDECNTCCQIAGRGVECFDCENCEGADGGNVE